MPQAHHDLAPDNGAEVEESARRALCANAENLTYWWFGNDLNHGLLPLWLKVLQTTQWETAWPQLRHLHQHREVHQGQANGTLLGQVEAQQDIVVQFHRCCWFLVRGERDVQDVSLFVVGIRRHLRHA